MVLFSNSQTLAPSGPQLTIRPQSSKLPDFVQGPPQDVGAGYAFQPFTRAKGTPPELLQGFPQIASYIGQGTEAAINSKSQAYRDIFRQRAEGLAGGQAEYDRRAAAAGAAQGYTPEFLKRAQFGRTADTMAQIGEAKATADAGFHDFLAEILKNTGTELADLTSDQYQQAFQAYLAYKARATARDAGQNQLLGSLAGLAGTAGGAFLGGPGGAALGASLFGGGGSVGGNTTRGPNTAGN